MVDLEKVVAHDFVEYCFKALRKGNGDTRQIAVRALGNLLNFESEIILHKFIDADIIKELYELYIGLPGNTETKALLSGITLMTRHLEVFWPTSNLLLMEEKSIKEAAATYINTRPHIIRDAFQLIYAASESKTADEALYFIFALLYNGSVA